jgi:DNA repair exonuclease SbcCD ATPase subunit
MKKNNEEVKSIPARIDELVGMKDGAADGDKKQLETDIKVLEKTLDERQAGLAAIKNGGRNAAIQQMNAEIEAKMTKFKAEIEADYNRKASEAERTINGCRYEIERLGREIERNQKDMDQFGAIADTADKMAAKLREEWNEVHAEPFPDDVSDTCPCCGQKLPAEKVESIRAAELQKFNLNKAERLKAIQEKGKNIMAGKQRDLDKVEELKAANDEAQARIEELSKSLEEAQKMLEGVSKPEPEKHPEYITLKEQLDFNLKSIANEHKDNGDEIKALEEEIEKIGAEISERQDKLAAIKQNEGIEARIEELKATIENQQLVVTSYDGYGNMDWRAQVFWNADDGWFGLKRF